MSQVIVRCHPGPGFDGIFRGGRKWPASGTVVELVDQDGDKAGEPFGLGRVTLEAIKADNRFSIVMDGGLTDIVKLKARVAELEAQLAEHKGKPEHKGKKAE